MLILLYFFNHYQPSFVLFFLPTVCFTVDGVRSDATSASELLAKMENEIDKSEGAKLDGVKIANLSLSPHSVDLGKLADGNKARAQTNTD